MARIGVLALQGDYLEHYQVLKGLGIEARYVKTPSDLRNIDALIIPGGESTTIGKLMAIKGMVDAVREFVRSGSPVMGTCAGAIVMAKKVFDRVLGETNQPTLELMDINVIRNIFGRQKNSFVARVYIDEIGDVVVAFIRAPGIAEAWNGARITGYIEHPQIGKIGVAAKQGNLIALTFHPEITGDDKVYRYFIGLVKR
ncbi:MAG: pyridoxal 5'-phosphate synthase glutaminase subunit PdxT [Ignisphaera sp.]